MAKASGKDVDPLKLKRERAGRYLTADGRFAVESATGGSWYLVHNERQNELGLPLMEGPFPTLDDARAEVQRAAEASPDASPPRSGPPSRALADAASETDRPSGAPEARQTEASSDGETPATKPNAGAARGNRTVEPETPAQPAWLTRLEPADAREAHRLLALLDRLGIDDPTLVRREVEGNVPEIARILLARRIRETTLDPWRDEAAAQADATDLPKRVRRHLRSEVEPTVEAAERLVASADAADLAAYAWLVGVRTAARLFEALELEGRTPPAPGQPGWRLVEVDGKGDSTGRQIVVDESDLLES